MNEKSEINSQFQIDKLMNIWLLIFVSENWSNHGY